MSFLQPHVSRARRETLVPASPVAEAAPSSIGALGRPASGPLGGDGVLLASEILVLSDKRVP